MSVLYLTPGVFDKGGISRYGRYQIAALRQLLAPACVTVLSLLAPARSRADLETPFDVDWHGKRAQPRAVDKAAFALAALRFCLRERPRVVWSAHVHLAAIGQPLARLVGATHVVQVYGREVWTPRPHPPSIGHTLRRADYVVADCHFTARYVADNLRPRRPVEVVWDCVDTERFSPAQPAADVLARYGIPDPARHFNILTLGRLSHAAAYKGYERLLNTLPRLPAHARLIFGGGGDLVPHLRAQAQQFQVAERVTFTGLIDDADLPDVYRSASVFCLIGDCGPGRGEGIPLTPLEAAACGVPILVGNQDGSREAVVQGVNGFALDPFDAEQIIEHLLRLAADAPYRLELGRSARERIEQEHAYPIFRDRIQRFLARMSAEAAKEK